jgi:hypothetical protein
VKNFFSICLFFALFAWIAALVAVSGCYSQHELEDSYGCEQPYNSDTEFPY